MPSPFLMQTALRERAFKHTKEALKKAITPDHFIIKIIHTIDELEGIINTLVTILRERYGVYAPHLVRNATAEEVIAIITAKKTDDLGISINAEDYTAIQALAEETTRLLAVQKNNTAYLTRMMEQQCPHLQNITGTIIGARLLNLAGSLNHLAALPSSTIQLLGAEKALFRHLRTGAKAPRFGILFAHENITKAAEKDRGKTARKLANKIAIAAKQDYYQ